MGRRKEKSKGNNKRLTENKERRTTINDKQLNLLMIVGLLIVAVLFLMSFDYLYNTEQFALLVFTAGLFFAVVFAIRMFKLKNDEIDREEKT